MTIHGIHFTGDINDRFTEALRNMLFCSPNLKNVDEAVLYLSSHGGSLTSAFVAYQYLRSVPFPISVVNMGTIESAAIIVFLAGTTRYTIKDNRFTIHPFSWSFNGPASYQQICEAMHSLEQDQEHYKNVFLERTSNASSPIDIKKCLLEESLILTNDFALSSGICTNIIAPQKAMALATSHEFSCLCI